MTTAEQNLFEHLKALQRQLPVYGQPWLGEWRDAGLARFARLGIPTRKTEQWKYTDVRPVLERDCWHAAPADTTISPGKLTVFELQELETLRLVFINGRYSAELSQTGSAEGLAVESLAESLKNRPALLQERLGALAGGTTSPFSAINTVLADQGAVIVVDDNREIAQPVHVMFINTGNPELFSAHPRLLISVGKNSKLDMIEHYVSLDATGQPLTNTVTEIFLADGGHCRYSKLLQAADNTVTVGGTYVRQSAHSDFESHTVCVGGGLVRNDLNILLAEPGAACRLNGVYLARNRQHVDNHTVIEHIAPHCSSREFYKGLITGRAHAVFNGRIHIHPGAQQSDAELSNKNLLLSAMAEIDTKPELEIYADDVKCSHGATVGELDQHEVFYLQSRGIEKEYARSMLSLAFINEVIEQLPYTELRDKLGATLESSLHEPEEA